MLINIVSVVRQNAYYFFKPVLVVMLGFTGIGVGATPQFDVDRDPITIWSQGVRLAGDIYKPKGMLPSDKLPGILLVNGWGGSKLHMGKKYGPQFASHGFVVLAFDYKGWGESDGPLLVSEPLPATDGAIGQEQKLEVSVTHVRRVVNPLSMMEDIRAALHYLGGEPQVVEDNIGIWGTSLGGGLALVTAANDDRIKAFVDQIGAVNFKANLEMITDGMARRWETLAARGEIAPYPGPEAVVNPALHGYPDWVSMKRYDPFSYVDKLNIPTLIIDAEDEELFAREKNGLVLFDAIKDRVEAKYVTYPGTHYGIYSGQSYKSALEDATQWFIKHLKGDADGPPLYRENCAGCHSNPSVRAPAFSTIKSMSTEKVLYALNSGSMKAQAAALSEDQRRALAFYLTEGAEDPRAWEQTMACGKAQDVTVTMPLQLGNWGYGYKNHRYQPAHLAGISADDLPKLKLAWSVAFPGTTEMRSQPVINGDTLFVGVSGTSAIYAFDLNSGCLQWVNHGEAPIRSALGLGELPGSDRAILFYGDAGGNVTVLNAEDGAVLWSKPVGLDQALITGSPVLVGEQLFVPVSTSEIGRTFNAKYECCKAHGGVVAFNIRDGGINWAYETVVKAAARQGKNSVGTQLWGPSGAPVWTTPSIDVKRNRLYIGTGENYSHPATKTSDAIIALDLDTGEELWVYQALADDVYTMACRSYIGFPDGPACPENYGPDFDFGASVIIATDSAGKDILLAGQKSGDVYALDPDRKGKLLWHSKLSDGTPVGGIHWGMSLVGNQLFVPIADPNWPISGWAYKPRPGLAALNIDTGKVQWRHNAQRNCKIAPATFNATIKKHLVKWPACNYFYGFSAATTAIDGAVLAGSLNGDLTAFSSDDGKPLWTYKTAKPHETINGVEGHGGALDNAGPVVANGWMVLQSGYSYINQMPGNVLLVFKVKDL